MRLNTPSASPFVLVAVVALTSTFGFLACSDDASSSDDAGSSAPDASNGDALPAADGGAGDARMPHGDAIADDAGDTTPGFDGGTCVDPAFTEDGGQITGPVGTRVWTAMDGLTVFGFTTDGYVVLQDSSAGKLVAAPVGGGPATTILSTVVPTLSASTVVEIRGSIVFAFTAESSGLYTLDTWTSAGGTKRLSSFVSVAPAPTGLGFFATDGTRVVYQTMASFNAPTGDVVISNVDGTAPSTLVSNVAGAANIAFTGGTIVVAYAEGVSTGAYPRKLSAFAGPSWTLTPLLSEEVFDFVVDPTGAYVVALTVGYELKVVPLATGAARTVDTHVTRFVLSPDFATILYDSFGLKRVPLAGGAPTELSPWSGLDGVTPAGDFVLLSPIQAPPPTDHFDLSAVPAVGGADFPLRSQFDVEYAFAAADGYMHLTVTTADGTRALFVTWADGALFTLRSTELRAGACPIPLGVTDITVPITPLAGTRVVFGTKAADVTSSDGGTTAVFELRIADAASMGAPTSLVGGVDPHYAVDTTHNLLAYSYIGGSSNAAYAQDDGVYVVAIP